MAYNRADLLSPSDFVIRLQGIIISSRARTGSSPKTRETLGSTAINFSTFFRHHTDTRTETNRGRIGCMPSGAPRSHSLVKIGRTLNRRRVVEKVNAGIIAVGGVLLAMPSRIDPSGTRSLYPFFLFFFYLSTTDDSDASAGDRHTAKLYIPILKEYLGIAIISKCRFQAGRKVDVIANVRCFFALFLYEISLFYFTHLLY